MPPVRRVPPEPPPQAEAPEPPYYEATEDLFIGGDAGFAKVAAYRTGSRVSPAAVERNGWGGKVRVPDRFAGTLTAPQQQEPPPKAASEAGGEPAGKDE